MIDSFELGPGGWSARLAPIRVAANLVIVAALASMTRRLWSLCAARKLSAATRSPRMLRLLAALIVLCGLSQLGAALADRASTPALPALLMLITATLWAATALRLRAVAAGLLLMTGQPPRVGPPSTTERLRARIRELEDRIAREEWRPEKSDALREIRAILADLEPGLELELEAGPCKS